MKKIIIIIFCFAGIAAYSQDLPNSGFDKVRIVEPGKVIVAEIKPVTGKHRLHKERFYAWYSANMIHATEGGFSGKLLNGQYNEFYLNKNLKMQGSYSYGLKTGTWKEWKEDGTLTAQSSWKKGVVLPDSSTSFWKRLPFIRKKKKQPVSAVKT